MTTQEGLILTWCALPLVGLIVLLVGGLAGWLQKVRRARSARKG